jgi:hypothetical protein
MNRAYGRARRACFDGITGLSYSGRSYRAQNQQGLFLLESLSAMAAGKQKRGSNEGRCGIIRGLKPFKMANSATQER